MRVMHGHVLHRECRYRQRGQQQDGDELESNVTSHEVATVRRALLPAICPYLRSFLARVRLF